jgi:hypothetical protein
MLRAYGRKRCALSLCRSVGTMQVTDRPDTGMSSGGSGKITTEVVKPLEG